MLPHSRSRYFKDAGTKIIVATNYVALLAIHHAEKKLHTS